MNFKPLRPRLKIGPYLQGKKGQNKPENPQNWNMAKIAPKSDKCEKIMWKSREEPFNKAMYEA